MEILNTSKLSSRIEQLFETSNEYSIIVSPYLRINSRLKPLLADCYKRNSRNLILYRKNNPNKGLNDELNWINKHTNVTILPIDNLHTKCYLNEHTAIITSMNLFDYSQINNHELGVLFSKEKEFEQLHELLQKLKMIITTDYHDFDISDFTNQSKEFTMGMLYEQLGKKFDFPQRFNQIDGTYLHICKIARQHHNFFEKDITDNGTKLLRATKLDESTYWKLMAEIGKTGVVKKTNH